MDASVLARLRARTRRSPDGEGPRRRLRKPTFYESIAMAMGFIAISVVSGVAYATIPSADGVISACYQKSGGALRIVDADTSSCSPKENLVTWNAEGPQGDPGLSGLQTVFSLSNFNSNSPKLHSVSCPAGKKVVGMGGNLAPDALNGSTSDIHMTQLTVSSDLTTVTVGAAEAPSGTSLGWTLVAQAICAYVAP